MVLRLSCVNFSVLIKIDFSSKIYCEYPVLKQKNLGVIKL